MTTRIAGYNALRSWRVVIIGFLHITLVLFCASQPVAATGVGGRPAYPDAGNPRTQSIFIYQLEPGEAKTDGLAVINSSDQTQTVEVYATDGLIANTGSFTCEQRIEAANNVGSWIQLDKQQLAVLSGEQLIVPFTIAAPSDVSPGEYNGCLVTQTVESPDSSGSGVTVRVRSAVRVAATIPGDLQKTISITQFGVATNDRTQQYSVTLENKGNVSADVRTEVRLKSLFGQNVFHAENEQPVLRDSSFKLSFTNDKLPFWGGWYRVEATATYNERAFVFGLDDEDGLRTVAADSKLIFILPQTNALISMAGCTLLLVGAGWYIRRHLARKRLNRLKSHDVRKGRTGASPTNRSQQ